MTDGGARRAQKASRARRAGAYVPPRLLVWTWIANWHAHPLHPTVVRWELTPTANGTRVRVTHSGLTQEPVSRKDYKGGWQGVLRLLHEFLRK